MCALVTGVHTCALPICFMAVGSFFNSRLVERIGARRLSQGSLIIFILLSGVHAAIATAGFENTWSFCALQAATMLAFAFTGRSEEHRVGKECGRTCRSGWWPDN